MSLLLLYITISLAIARLTLMIVRDDISLPLRELIFKYSPPEAIVTNGRADKNPDFDETKPVSEANPPSIWTQDLKRAGWWGQVVSCPDCCAPYVAAGMLLAYHFVPDIIYIYYILAASMVVSLIARKY